ncbi:OmpA family protein [Formosa sp. PL04]|uniref:OmpA/MotB family protein n=1 Tax=Formosa sp. PL04 TaxID=3081755 RepID=UPI00298128F2|nr:OmpA family protein [Formosa sp. PL04]MDW5289456.1 OmpA family protein [Formosa sp. PL04]
MIKNSESSWISFSDLMTALMVIFMFIAISYISEVEKEKDKVEIILNDFQNTKDSLLVDLKNEFSKDFQDWNVEMDDNLSIKFTNPDILFAKGKKNLRPKFREVLDSFLPRYFNILLSDQYRSKILEIRIEGHTDKSTAWAYDKDPYISNIMLSQERSTEVLKYFKDSDYYNNLSQNYKSQLLFMLTSNGLSFGRMLDNDKELVEVTKNEPNDIYSRRVEFKIVTRTEEAFDEILKQLK